MVESAVAKFVDDDAIEAYARDGVVVVRGLLNSADIESLAQGIDHALETLSDRAVVASGESDEGAFIEEFLRWIDVPQIEEIALRSPVAEVAASLMDAISARFYHDHILVKEPGTTQRTPWHQDQPYYNVDGTGISAWISVDPVPKNGSPEFWAGSHLGPWRMPRSFLDKEAKWFPEGALAEIPDIEADRSAYDIRQWELVPGDAVFFSFLTVHSAPGFPFESRRRVASLRYLAPDAKHAVRPWTTSPPFPGLVDELADGAPMEHPNFPIAWPR